MMQMPFSAYRGDEKYIFVSYAHKDAANVFPAIKALHNEGYRIWYDEGIEAGDDWSETISEHLEKAEVVVYFMSRNSAGRENVERELAAAAEQHKPVLTVMIGSFRLTPEQEKQSTVNQFLRLDACRTYGEFADAAEPALRKYDVRESTGALSPSAEEKRENSEKGEISAKKKGTAGSERVRIYDETKKKMRRGLAVMAAVLLVFVLFCGFLFRRVPAVVGMKTEDAVQAVADAGFRSAVSMNYSDTYEYGTVFEQSEQGTTLRMVPVVITQSLGPEENLTDVPDVVGTEISDGARRLIEAGLKKFSVVPEFDSALGIGYISAQSIPAGLRVSRSNHVQLEVRTDGGEYTFTIEGKIFILTGSEPLEIDVDSLEGEPAAEEKVDEQAAAGDDGSPLSLDHPEQFQMTEAEWELFRQNNRHSVSGAERYAHVWLPAAFAETMEKHPEESFGWVIVRDMVISAETLFAGYQELYVCPGVTVTVQGSISGDVQHDYYVAPGGTLVFSDEVNGGVYLVNDGKTEFGKNVNSGGSGVLIANRGEIEVAGTIGRDVKLWSFFGSSVSGKDETGGTLRDYSPYRQVTADRWYEGCSGEKGFTAVESRLEIFAGYPDEEEGTSMEFRITPVLNPEDYEDHYQEEWYTSIYLFLNDYTVDRFRNGRGMYWELIAAPGVTLTIDTPEQDQSAAAVAEEGGTVIINSDIRGYYPYSPYFVNDGTMIFNGTFLPEDNESGRSTLMNRGTFIANGTFGGTGMYVYNFSGASFTGNIADGTHVQDIGWRPDYVSYDNGPNGALRYQEDVLAAEYGYPFFQHPEQ